MKKRYIVVDEVMSVLEKHSYNQFSYPGFVKCISPECRQDIKTLDSISPEEIIEKMIEELKNDVNPERVINQINILEELLTKFRSY